MMAFVREDEWLWGWDETPGIVSVWADVYGRAIVWRRDPASGALIREEATFRPWLLLGHLDDLRHLGAQLSPEGEGRARFTYRTLEGPGELKYVVSADSLKALSAAVLVGASRRLGRLLNNLRDLGKEAVHVLPPEEQYLVATGRTYFRGLTFDRVRRLQFDLETTGLDPSRDRIFLIAVRDPEGRVDLIESPAPTDEGEAELIRHLVRKVQESDPDVIENHNLHGFDLPFLDTRARRLGVPLGLGRTGPPGLRERAARRGVTSADGTRRRVRLIAPGREFIDTMDAVLRHDFSARDLPGHGLKAVAKHLGLAKEEREHIRGDLIHEVYRRDPDRVRRYAAADVEEVEGLARLFGGASFALAQMAPRRYERLADAGAATGIIDPLLVRAYLRANRALPAYRPGRDVPHSGAALHLFASGVALRVVKADVASLYPSLMRSFRIGPARDDLGAMLAIVDRLVEERLRAKSLGKTAPPGSAERHTYEATSAAMKLVINSAYGYLAAGGGLTRFADVDAANEVTRRGRETLGLICRELAARGAILLEADTDGVYFASPPGWTEADERRVVAEVSTLLPRLVQLEFEGRYASMLSHEPKNYALRSYEGKLILRGVAFRSSRAEPYGEVFLRRAIDAALRGDPLEVRAAYVETVMALRRRELPTFDVSSRVRLTKTSEEYAAIRGARRELTYEAMIASGRPNWTVGDRVRVYRTRSGSGGVVEEADDGSPLPEAADSRDYDVDWYVRLLKVTYASRLARAFAPDDYEALFADPGQMSLFSPAIATIQSILTRLASPPPPGPRRTTLPPNP